MRKMLLLSAELLVALALATPVTTHAQAQVRIRMAFPRVLPPLVEIEPGYRVVQDFDEEVFFVHGYYWVQRDGYWYRARDHRGTWRHVEPYRVPGRLVRYEPGRYRHWQHDDHRAWPDQQHARHGARHWRPQDHHETQPQPQRHEAPRPGQGNDHR